MHVDARFEEALRSPEPVAQLRSLAERLLAEHHDETAVRSSFEEVRRQLRESGREADEDVLLDVMDFLTGWCSPHVKLRA